MNLTQLAFPRQAPRLLLRPLVPDDQDAIHHLYGDWAVARWLSRLPWPFTRDSAETLIAEAVSDVDRGRGLFLALTHRTAGSFVGTVSLRLPALDANPWTNDTRVLRHNVASRHVLERVQFRIWRSDVREVPRYGGPARLGDTFILDRADWNAADRASMTGADRPTPSA
jgi:RimJ/RimL family protein N-acetyltransferase